MRFRTILIFLCCLAFVPFVMGQKGGCGGGQLRFGEEVIPPPEYLGPSGQPGLEFAGEPPPEGEPGAEEEGPPPAGEVKGPDVVKDFCVERPPEVEERPKRGCPTCNSLLPLDADVVASLSLGQALSNPGLMMFLGELQTIVSNVGSNLNLNLVLEDPTKDLVRFCSACKLSQAPGEGGARQEGGMLYDTAPQMSIAALAAGGTDVPDAGMVMAPDLSGGLQNYCEEFVLIFEGNWKEEASSEQYLISLEGSNVLNTLSFVAETVVVPSAEPKTSTLQLDAPLEAPEAPADVPYEGPSVDEPLILRQPAEPLILRQPDPLILRQPAEPLILRQPESAPTQEGTRIEEPIILDEQAPTRDTIILDEQAPTRDTIFFDKQAPAMQLVPTGLTGKGEVASVSTTVATFNDAEGQPQPLRAGFKDGMLVFGTENYFNAVVAKDSCPLQELWLSVPEGLLKMAGPVQILPLLLGQQAGVVSLGAEGVVVYDFGERLYLAIRTVDAEGELALHVMFKVNAGAVNADQLLNAVSPK